MQISVLWLCLRLCQPKISGDTLAFRARRTQCPIEQNNSLIFYFVKTLKISAHSDNFYSRKKSCLNELKFCKGFYLNKQKSFIPKENFDWLWFICIWYLNWKKCFHWINWTNIVKHWGRLNGQEKMYPKLIQFIFTSS